MRVLFSSVPAPSHVAPMLPLAQALAVEHDVTFATGRPLVGMVEDAGLRAVPMGVDWSEPDAARTFPELNDMPIEDKAKWWYYELFLDRAGRPMAQDLAQFLDDEPVDVIVRTQLEFGAWAASQAHGVPQLVVGLGGTHQAEHIPAMHERLEGLLLAAGAPPNVTVSTTWGDRFLLLHPESYDDWVPPVPWQRFRVPVPLPADPPKSRPEVLSEADGRPVVLVTFGTVFNQTPGVFELVLQALAQLDVFGVVTVGRTRDPDALTAPDNVVVKRFLPYDELLPHCRAVVSHGGLGTVMSALVHGLPLVIVALSADQPVHAAACRDLGVAEATMFGDATADWVERSLDRVLTDDRYRTNAEQFGGQIRDMRPITDAKPLVEELAVAPPSRGGRP